MRVVVAATLLRTERLQRPIILVIAQPLRAPSERLPAWDALDTANMVTAATDTNSNDVFMEFLLGNDRRSSGEGPVHSAH